MNHYPHHIGDRLKDSSHFTLLEHGVHIRLMEVYYTREKPYADDREACYLIGAKSATEKAAVRSVLSQTFKKTDDGWLQTRCETELQRYKEKAVKASQSASARWNKPQCEGNANASKVEMRTQCEGNANQNQNQEPIKSKPLSADADAYPPGFQKFWEAFPNTKRKGGRKACFKVWSRSKLEPSADAIVAHVLGMAESADWQKNGGEFIPMPATYLNQARWDGADLSAPPVGRDYGQCTWNLNGTRDVGGRCEFRATALHPGNGMARCEHHIARN